MSGYSIPSLLAVLTLASLFYYSYSHGKPTTSLKLLLAIIFIFFLYALSEFFLLNAQSTRVALLWDKILFFAAVLAVPTYLNLTLFYPKPFSFLKKRPIVYFLVYLPSLSLAALLLTDRFIAGIQREYWGWGKIQGPVYEYFRFYMLAYFIAALVSLQCKRRYSDPCAKNGLNILGMAYLGPMLITILVVMVFQPLGINALNIMVVPASLIAFASIIAYAITQQKLLYDTQLLFAPAIKTEKYFFHQKIKSLISNIHAHDFDYKRLVGMLHDTLKCAVGLDLNGITVADHGGDEAFLRFRLEKLDQEIWRLDEASQAGQAQLRLLSQATFDNFDAIHGQLDACGIEAILPIYDDGRVIGTLKFGRGFSEQIYSRQDFQLISTLCNQFVVALKYIRELEAQVALKDNLIGKLRQRILLKDGPRPMAIAGGPTAAPAARAVLIAKTTDLELPLPDVRHYADAQGALQDTSADIYIVDGRHGNLAEAPALGRSDKPLVIIGSPECLPDTLEGRWVDVVKPQHLQATLAASVQSMLALRQAARFQTGTHDFMTASPKLLDVLARLRQAATASKTILINGETGTGKELIAAYIGQLRGKKIISVNCAAVSRTLFESEFCGHERGAFTGAEQCRRGYLEQADKAILFLDEISELPLDLQAKLLRIIEGAPFQRVGGRSFLRPDVQFVCATNRDLKAQVKAGTFREDLMYRLDQLSFHLPPLRERKEDIALLGAYYLLRYKRQHRVDALMDEATLKQLKSHPWPGNVRELSNTILKWVLNTKHETDLKISCPASLPERLRRFEAALIHESLKRHDAKRQAARDLGIPFSTLRSKLKKLDIQPPLDQELNEFKMAREGASLTEMLHRYEAALIGDCLKACTTQSEAARQLGIPLSTLRSKLKKHQVESRPNI